ncbi:MAG: thioredoxin family protein [Prevotella sp.]|nr:thioredoxin family protein [Prevotella sp.]
MSSKRLLFMVSVLMIPFILNAQKITIALPQHANKEYVFVLHKGINQDTIQKGVLPFTGKIDVWIPDTYKDYAGMGRLIIKDMPTFNMIVNHEDFSVEQGADGKYIFNNSAENKYLYSIIQDRIIPEEDTTLYASRFIQLIRYNQALNKVISQRFPNLKEKGAVRSYALNDLSFETLYTSSLWYNIIDALVKLNGDQQALGEYMTKLLGKIRSDEVYVHLVDNLITITEQYGWDDAFDIIIPYVEQSGRIPVPQDKIYTAFILAKVRKGMEAPKIEGLSKSIGEAGEEKALIVFYQPDCENCHIQLKQLINEYSKLESEKIRVISISGGDDNEVFEQDLKNFPWTDKLCDFNGYSGKNFMNYGIMGTPTFFLLDKKGKVLRRFAQISELMLSNAVL